jgi:hypothetical protein
MNLYLYIIVARFAISWVYIQAAPTLTRPLRRPGNE